MINFNSFCAEKLACLPFQEGYDTFHDLRCLQLFENALSDGVEDNWTQRYFSA